MRTQNTLLLGALTLLAAACVAEDPTQPPVEQVVAEARSLRATCRPEALTPFVSGEITADDCLYDLAGRQQREDLYHLNQPRLGLSDRSGAYMLTFRPDASFEGLYGVSKWDGSLFGDPVYGFQRFPRALQSFSFIGSEANYKLYLSGADGTQLGSYTLETTVEPSRAACDVGRRVYIAGNVTFSSHIDDASSCAGTIVAGPNAGGPLRYQFVYAKLKEGQEVTVRLEDVDGNDPTIVLAALVFGAPGAPLPFEALDFPEGPGDTDRSLTFTAPLEAYYYLEVSGIPGVDSPYTFSFQSQ